MAHRVLESVLEHAEEIRALGPVNEKLGRLDDKAAKVLRDSGVIRMLQPAEFGGMEAHPRDFAETVMGIAKLDGSAGWVAGIVGVHPWELAFMDRRIQEEVWGEDADTWMASPYAPMGVATPVAGGYRFSGRWQFSTGTDHCDWVFLGGMLGTPEGSPVQPPQMLHLLLPRGDYTIVEDSWDVAGLRGTGSKDIIVDGAFVPDYRVIGFESILSGAAPKSAGLGQTLYNVPFSAVFPLGITSAVIGIAEGALAAHIAWQRDRVQITGTKIKDDPYVLTAISGAAAEIEAARETLLAFADRTYAKVDAGGEPTFAERAAGRRTQVSAAWRAVRAVDEIIGRSGGNALRLDNPVQRYWRDAHMGLNHAIHVPGSIFHSSALTDLGVDPPPGQLRAMI
ncbi:acyl-CoA dehydrogenase family protein [Nocardiopsis coralliicola]